MTQDTYRKVQRILREAARIPTPCDFTDYEKFKKQLQRCGLAGGEYDRAVCRLCEIMEL